MNKFRFNLLIMIFILLLSTLSFSQLGPKFKIDALNNPAPGYLFIGPLSGSYLALYDNSGNPVYSKEIAGLGGNPNAFRILSNGNLAFFTSQKWFILDKHLHQIDQISAAKPYETNFHTLRTSSTGNYLLVANEYPYVDMSVIVSGGKNSARIWNNRIQEYDRNKNLVFDWNCLEHIDITDAVEDINLLAGEIDPYHINSADYDWDGNIIANFRNLDAFIKINRSTGDIMWIMGGSKSRKNQFTFINDTKDGFTGFSHQHDPKRLPNGNILLFDNANLSPGKSSRAVEYQIDESAKTARKVWEYHYPSKIFAEFQGNAQRLPNGNTLIGWGINIQNKLATEVTSDGQIVLDMSLAGNTSSYQVLRHVVMMNAVTKNLYSVGAYSFNDNSNNTDVTINITSMQNGGTASVEKHEYEPYNILFESQPACTYLPYRWVLNYRNITQMKAKIFINLSSFFELKNKDDLRIFWREKENSGAFKRLNTVYDPQMDRLEAEIDKHGEFFIGYSTNVPPNITSPKNNADNIPLVVNLSWFSTTGSTNFLCQVATDEEFENIVFERYVNGSNQVLCTLTKNNSKYYWRVKGTNSSCDKHWSDVSSFTTVIAPAELTSPENKSTGLPLIVDLSWNYVEGASEYVVQVSEDSTFKTYILSTKNSESNSFKIKNLTPLTNYYWRILAGKNGHLFSSSDFFRFKTGNGKVILKLPYNNDTRTALSGFLKWQSVNSVNSYNVQITRFVDFRDLILDTIVLNNTEVQYTDLNHSTAYYWRVKGFVKDSSTDWSDIWHFKTKIGYIQLLSPANMSSDNKIDVKLEWESFSEAISYNIQISKDSVFSTPIYDSYSVTKSFLNYDGFDWNSAYYWRVRAFDGHEYSTWSQAYSFSTINQQISPGYGQFKVPVEVVFEWNPISDANYYEIRVSKDPNFGEGTKYFSYIQNKVFKSTELQHNTTYYWSIRSMRETKFTNWSNSYMFTTRLAEPIGIHPVDLIFTSEVHELTFKWTETKDKEQYHLQIATDDGFSNMIIDSSMITTEKFDLYEKLDSNTYYWRVIAHNSKNSSNWSDTKKFKIEFPTVDVQYYVVDSDADINVFPNPFSSESYFGFNLAEPEFVKIKVFSAEGKELDIIVNEQLQDGEHQYKFDSKNLNSGLYYFVFIKGNHIQSGQFVVIK